MIRVNDLEVVYGTTVAVRDLSFIAEGGSILSIIGPNGSGKSSLLKSLIGLVKPKEGKIEIKDSAIFNQDTGVSAIGYMPQSPFFPKNLKVKELIEFFKRLEPVDSIDFPALYEILGLKEYEDQKFGALSGGTKQKVNILQCFSAKKPIYIVDEPTASLDPYISHLLKNLLKRKKEEGALVIFSTHILNEVEEIADRFLLMAEGRLLIDDSPKEFIRKNQKENLQSTLMEFWNQEFSKTQ
ncbi:ABC transporter ATP-binding protein [Leptospira sp. 201903070]|jgi:Cu-processing system ATP-binding protein|uniref:ABC transporter ATP-binding protein n=1 Tax=Leptospira ainlahdjerensis TaxID=2810033 RepID=A0ABS2UH96_9LEPT|nr:ABC transporter ATP-binding protein [Leptospira ainlahdjerensis]MBM9579747.1 ABC transporter ATP-binding protein [Leptospira ainlahdjerensis]